MAPDRKLNTVQAVVLALVIGAAMWVGIYLGADRLVSSQPNLMPKAVCNGGRSRSDPDPEETE